MQDNIRTAASASKSAQISLVNADFDLFLASLKLDQVTFRATRDGPTAASLATATAFACSRFPVFYGTPDTLASHLPSQHASWVTTATTGKLGMANIVWVNFSALGVPSTDQLEWVAHHVAAEMHSAPATSVAILIHSNRSNVEFGENHRPGFTFDYSDSIDAEFEVAGVPSSSRCSSFCSMPPGVGPLSHWHQTVENMFSATRLGLMVTNAQIIFRPDTVWGNRKGHHGMMVVLPRSGLPRHRANNAMCTGSLCASHIQPASQPANSGPACEAGNQTCSGRAC